MRELRFAGGAVLRPQDSQLIVDGRPAQIGGRALDVLCAMALRPGEVVTKRELMDHAWPNLVVEENNLQVQISSLRRLLGPASIITVAGRGYRLVAQLVEPAAPPPASPETAGTGPGAAALLERQDSLQTLWAAFEAARGGAGSVCLVYGEAGIGKSSLCNAFLSGLGAARVLRGGCEALFSPRPLGPLHDFIGDLDATARALIGQDNARAELFSHLLAVLQQRPAVLLLEDLHWADEATLDFVKFLGRRIRRAPVLMVLTYRDDELSAEHPLRQVIGDLQQSVRRIGLQPLSQSAIQELASQAGRRAEGILATTGGNPFYVTELLEAGGLPATVRDAVQARIARQPPAVKALLELTSAVPGRIEHWIVEALADPDGSAVQEALSSGLLLSDGETLRFRHELARLAVEQSIAAPQLRRLHARLLECLQRAAGAPIAPARLVHHAKAAGRVEDVLHHAPLAAEAASRRGAFREAAALYDSALQWGDRIEPQQRAQILEACGFAAQQANAVAHALDCFGQARSLWKDLGRVRDEARALCLMSRAHWYLGSSATGLECVQTATTMLEAMPETPEYLQALRFSSSTAMLGGRYREAIAIGNRAIDLAERHGDQAGLAHILNNVGSSYFAIGQSERGLPLLRRSLDIATRLRDADSAARAYTNMFCFLIDHRRYEEAADVFAQSDASFIAGYDLDVWEHYSRGWRARAHFECGRWTEAQADAQAVLDQIYPSGSLTMRIPSLHLMARLKAARGEPDAAGALRDLVAAAETTGEVQRLTPAYCARSESLWLAGAGLGDAAGATRDLWEVARAHENVAHSNELGYWLWIHGEAIDPIDPASPRALQMAGRWREAASAWQAIGCPLERGQALLQGDAGALSEAEAIFESLGASAYVAKARAIRSAAGEGTASPASEARSKAKLSAR